MVKLSSSVSEAGADTRKTEEASVYGDLLTHRDVVCLPQLRFGGSVIHE